MKREIPLLNEYGIFFSLYVFHMKLGLSLFLDLYISMARNCNCPYESSVYYTKLRAHYMLPCNFYILLVRFYIVPFQLSVHLFLSRAPNLMGNRQINFLSLNKLRFWLFLMLETFVVTEGI